MTWSPPDQAVLEARFIEACLDELAALKPGNVHIHGDGHGMTVRDFEVSARAAAPFIARRGTSVGERIEAAIAATWNAVGTNTNLGIVLLAAPLLAAMERPGALRQTLEAILEDLTLTDAEAAYRAIRMARPAGLGTVEQGDVATAPTLTLRQAMALAATHDRIAAQYVTGFRDIFEIGVPTLRKAQGWGWDRPSATTLCYLEFLASHPDSHLERKFGSTRALAVTQEAQKLRDSCVLSPEVMPEKEALMQFDQRLKAEGLNPGTSADMTVASLLASAGLA